MAKDVKEAVLREWDHWVWLCKENPWSDIYKDHRDKYYKSIPALSGWLKEREQ